MKCIRTNANNLKETETVPLYSVKHHNGVIYKNCILGIIQSSSVPEMFYITLENTNMNLYLNTRKDYNPHYKRATNIISDIFIHYKAKHIIFTDCELFFKTDPTTQLRSIPNTYFDITFENILSKHGDEYFIY